MKIKLKFGWNVKLVFRFVRNNQIAIYLGKCESVAGILFFCSQPAKRRWMVITAVKFYLESVFNYSGFFFLNHSHKLMKFPVKDCDHMKTFTMYMCKALWFVTVSLVVTILNIVYRNMVYSLWKNSESIIVSVMFNLYPQTLERWHVRKLQQKLLAR